MADGDVFLIARHLRSTRWGAARSQIFPVSLSGQTPPCGCTLESSGVEVCCLRSLPILVSAHWLINRGSFNCTLTLTKWTDVIYQLGVQWGDVGRKCLLTELFFISSLAQSALHCTPLKGLKQFSSCSDDGVFFYCYCIFFFLAHKIPPLGTICRCLPSIIQKEEKKIKKCKNWERELVWPA